jgi:hypothetical protein
MADDPTCKAAHPLPLASSQPVTLSVEISRSETGTTPAHSKIRNCTVIGNSVWPKQLPWWRLHHSVIDLTSFIIWSESFQMVRTIPVR